MILGPHDDTSAYPYATVVADTTITYHQESDVLQGNSDGQSLKLSTNDNGVGHYITIETTRWAIDSIESLKEIIDDFCKRSGIPPL